MPASSMHEVREKNVTRIGWFGREIEHIAVRTEMGGRPWDC